MTNKPATEKQYVPAKGGGQIVLVGLNHRTAPISVREKMYVQPEQAQQIANRLVGEGLIAEGVVLSTCNRTELYGISTSSGPDLAQDLITLLCSYQKIPTVHRSDYFYSLTGADAVAHLYRVASGLDSMLIGEAEILGQVRNAYLRAFGAGNTGSILNRLFQAAIEVGRRARTETEIGARPMSVAFAAIKLAELIFGNFKSRCALVLGAGRMAEQAVEHLHHRGLQRILVANRTFENAVGLARRVRGEPMNWQSLENGLEAADLVICSVSLTRPIIRVEHVRNAMINRQNRPLFLLDLGVPRNIEPEVRELYNVFHYNLDELTSVVEQNRKAREKEIPRVEALVMEHVQKFNSWQSGMRGIFLLRELRERIKNERDQFIRDRMEEVQALAVEDRDRLMRLTEDLVLRLMSAEDEKSVDAREICRRWDEIEAMRGALGFQKEQV